MCEVFSMYVLDEGVSIYMLGETVGGVLEGDSVGGVVFWVFMCYIFFIFS